MSLHDDQCATRNGFPCNCASAALVRGQFNSERLSQRCHCGGGKRDADGRCVYCRSLVERGIDEHESYEAGLEIGGWVGFVVGLAFGLVVGLTIAKLFFSVRF